MNRFVRTVSLFLAVVCCLMLFSAVGSAQQQNSAEAEPSETKGDNDKLIALTFDDGPGKHTDRLLTALRKRGVHCTFFVVGQYAKIYPSTIRQCYEDGHQLASHSYTHAYLTKLSDSQIRSELQRTNDAVNDAVGCKLSLMLRPPYGAYNSHVLEVAGVPAFYWSDDSGDWWQGATADSVYNNTIRTAGDGDILLLHDSHSWSVDAAIRIVDKLLADGYEFVTLSELFRRRGVPLKAGHIYSYLRANGTNLPGISKPKVHMTVVDSGMQISMTSDVGTKIYYTTDGSIPNTASKVYKEPFVLSEETTLTAVAGYDMNGSRSNRTTVSVPKIRRCEPPVISIDNGKVTITAKDTIYYTTDVSNPTTASAVYKEPFTVQPGTLIRAMACSNQPNTACSRTVGMFYSLNANVFDDILPKQWYTDAVDAVVTEGLMEGTAQYHFAPSLEVSRAQIVTVLFQMCKASASNNDSGFADVPKGKWFTDAVIWAEENGIVSGYSDGLFHPNDALSREQTAVILNGFARYCGYETEYPNTHGSGLFGEIGAQYAKYRENILNKFSDGAQTSPYAQKAVKWAVIEGIIAGNSNGQLMPKASLSRAQLALIAVVFRSCEARWKQQENLPDAMLLKLSNEVFELLETKDFEKLAAYIHPKRGLSFTPFSSVGDTDIILQRDALAEAAQSEEPICWGFWDGSGEDILMTFDEYWERFVLNTDYSKADRVTPNAITVNGTSVENVSEAFGNCLFVEYAVDSCTGNNDGTDWSTLKLVFTCYERQWYLTAIIHGEWAP